MKFRLLVLFAAICFGHFYVDAMFGVWPLWKTIAGYNIAEAGFMTGLAVLLGEGMQTFFGTLSDRGMTKKLLLAGLFLSSVTLLYPFASFPLACFFFFATCVSSASFHPSAISAVSHIPLYAMPLMMAIFQTAGFLGVAFGQKIFLLFFSHSPYVTLLLFLVPLVLSLFLFRASIKHPEPVREVFSLTKVLSSFWKKPVLKWLYLLLVMNQSVFWAFVFLLPEIVGEKGMSDWFRLGGGTLLFMTGAASACIPLGIVAARLDIVRMLSILLALAAVLSTLFLFFTSFLDPFLLFAFGGVVGGVTPLALALGSQLEPRKRGMISAYLMGGVWIVSETMGYTVSSLVYSCIDVPKATNTLQLFSIFLFIGILLAHRVKKHFYGPVG